MRWFVPDRDSRTPLIRQIYDEVSAQILSGDMAAGEKLPSTREASRELGVSRNVVIEAYDQLAAEGYVLPISGGGTYVAEGSFLGTRRTSSAVSTRREAIASDAAGIIDFDSGRPALDLVPFRKWARYEYAARLETATDSLGYAPPGGLPELRETLSKYLLRKRGIECAPAQIIITSGALQGVALVARCLLGPGSTALVEDPGTPTIKNLFESEGAEVVPVRVDNEGIRSNLLPEGTSPALLFLTPSHQFPLGGCLSIQRRVSVINYARRSGCVVLEDDYESEFRYDRPPVSSLQRLDPDRVAYVGTFSKIFIPSLRLGYLVAPPSLVEGCRFVKRLNDRFSPTAQQLAMSRFIEDGRLDRHVAGMKKIYEGRRNALIAALESYFPKRIKILGDDTGLHLVAGFEGVAFDPPLLERIREAGVVLYPVEDLAMMKGHHRNQVVMGYSHLPEDRIREGVAIMKKIIGS